MESILERLNQPKPILLDGATGTELNRHGIDISLPLWSASAIESAPDVLRQIHSEYISAGAEILTANTFRTHKRNLIEAGQGDRAGELTQRAIEIARSAAGDSAWVAGSQAPLEDCYFPQGVPDDEALKREHAALSRNLADAGVDLILVETQNTIREAVAAAHAATRTGIPTFVSFVCGMDGRLLSGETLADAVTAVLPLQPAALLVNCIPAESALSRLEELKAAAPNIPFGAYANIGKQEPDGSWIDSDAVDPECYARYAESWLNIGAKLIGGCCGTTPEHIQKMKDLMG
jgi:homocysteine S-methyltransferase